MSVQKYINSQNEKQILLAFSSVLFLALYIIMVAIFKQNLLISDVSNYWNRSQSISFLFDSWWVPGYPFVIYIFSKLLLNFLPPIILMVVLSYLFFISSTLVTYSIIKSDTPNFAFVLSAFFVLFPFTGLTYSVYPVADSMAIAFIVFSIWAFKTKKWVHFTIFASISLFTHKITWFFIPVLLLFSFIVYPASRKYIIWTPLPLALYCLAGVFYTQDFLWMIRYNLDVHFTSPNSIPFFSGILGNLIGGTTPEKVMKAVIVFVITAFAIASLFFGVRFRDWLVMSIAVGFILMALIINEGEIWCVVRYGKLLIFPLWAMIDKSSLYERYTFLFKPVAYLTTLLLGLLSNLIYSYYIVIYFK